MQQLPHCNVDLCLSVVNVFFTMYILHMTKYVNKLQEVHIVHKSYIFDGKDVDRINNPFVEHLQQILPIHFFTHTTTVYLFLFNCSIFETQLSSHLLFYYSNYHIT